VLQFLATTYTDDQPKYIDGSHETVCSLLPVTDSTDDSHPVDTRDTTLGVMSCTAGGLAERRTVELSSTDSESGDADVLRMRRLEDVLPPDCVLSALSDIVGRHVKWCVSQ
jgi:hypothetical protein